ncbi:uncharacterized protein LOC109721831 isoform X3 [Ananas comosus]|uniref:Uncharacterized protein LOC109721831 isoform X3 n=1 Tax=Ananas comosus TaxID=4615 RepID=A0A6P5GAL4_ANACO|nr:uncharacterized protein LOC109721831 isoform X3 [Ananas comosus]
MLQLLFAVAFSAAPLTLYVPPVRCLNHFVAALEAMLREAAPSSLRAYLRLRLGFRRLRFALLRFLRCLEAWEMLRIWSGMIDGWIDLERGL